MNRQPVRCRHFIYRPLDPAGRHDNVYVDWDGVLGVYQAIEEARTAGVGEIVLEFDAVYAPEDDAWDELDEGYTEALIRIPARDESGTPWDMHHVKWYSRPQTTNSSGNFGLVLPDNCVIDRLNRIDISVGYIININTVQSPILVGETSERDSQVIFEGNCMFIQTKATAKPMFKLEGQALFRLTSMGTTVLGDGFASETVSPVVDLNGQTLFTNLGSVPNCFTDLSMAADGTLRFVGTNPAVADWKNSNDFSMDDLPSTVTVAWQSVPPLRTAVYTTAVATTAKHGTTLLVDTTAAVLVTLPLAKNAPGMPVIVLDATNNATAQNITFAAQAGETIVGTATISADDGYVWLMPDGVSKWFVVNHS